MTHAPPSGSATGTGAPAPSDRNSLTIGPDGPILLFDYWKNVDSETGKRIEEAVRTGRANPVAPHETPASGIIGSQGH